MAGPPRCARRLAIALAVCAGFASGCASWQFPRIDPSGERIFLPAGPVAVAPPGAVTVPGGTFPQSQPQVIPQAVPQVVAPQTVAPQLVPGSGAPQTVVVPRGVGMGSLAIAPRELVAPVGGEVIVVAALTRGDGLPDAGQRVEWMLAPEGVGHFIEVGESGFFNLFRLSRNMPQKIDSGYAIGETTASAYSVTRGTPNFDDDLIVQPGQAWITVTSPIAGTSHVTAFAPSVPGWERRRGTATIHWVDAQWVFPPPATNPVGTPHVFTTSVSRRTDGTPIAGWTVRYEVLGGAAGFSPDGSAVVEVPTNELGQASAEIIPQSDQPGTSQIGVQIIRPPLPGASDARRLVLASGSTSKTWTAPDVAVRTSGPSTASVGSTLSYRIEVSNPTGVSVRDARLSAEIPNGLTYLGSSPPVDDTGAPTWQLGELQPGQGATIQVDVRAEQAGQFDFCASVRTAEGLAARSCATTVVSDAAGPTGASALEVRIEGPQTAAVGSTARFEVTIVNRGTTTATGLEITDRFDPGLRHLVSESPIQRSLDDLASGASTSVYLTFRVTQPGELCHTVEVTSADGGTATASACVTATGAAESEDPSEQPDRAGLSVNKTGPAQRRVGEMAEFRIELRNTGEVPLTNFRIVDTYEMTLEPELASEGVDDAQPGQLVWTLERLEPGQAYHLRVQCRCLDVSARACNRVTVECDQRPPIVGEACLQILPAQEAAGPQPPADVQPSPSDVQPPTGAQPTPPDPPPPTGAQASRLQLSIADFFDPVRVGGEARYRIFVENPGTMADQNVTLTIRFPTELQPGNIEAPSGVQSQIEGQTIRFQPVAEIRAGETITFTIPFTAQQAGRAEIVAELSSDRLARPLSVQEQTEILPQQ